MQDSVLTEGRGGEVAPTINRSYKRVLTRRAGGRRGWIYVNCQSTVNFTVNTKPLIDNELCIIFALTVKILKIDNWYFWS